MSVLQFLSIEKRIRYLLFVSSFWLRLNGVVRWIADIFISWAGWWSNRSREILDEASVYSSAAKILFEQEILTKGDWK